MRKHYNPKNYFSKGQNKGKQHLTQLQRVYSFLLKRTATASMVTDATGIPQKCVTRYKRQLELSGLLWQVERKPCKITAYYAWYITADKKRVKTRTKCKRKKNLNRCKK